ncbi:MAG: UDP-N-acetylmuramoyl-L-alanyl-D-glutamate--2,6-diaminopimelate ligase [Anaerolineales bacterium]
MQLSQLFSELSGKSIGGPPEAEITGLAADSRLVQPGALFVAVRGSTSDGHDYLLQAQAQGAAAAVGELDPPDLEIPYLQVPDSRLALAQLAAAYYHHPARSMVMIGVTGTDGKSTTCNLLYSILERAGISAGMITTVNAVIGETLLDTGLHVTTPDAIEVHGYMRQMVDAGLTHCILETTSHGLAQHRVSACDFDLALVTNITHEHLDYHGSFEAYRDAKGRLFRDLSTGAGKEFAPPKTAVLNLDDSSYQYLAQITNADEITYGLSQEAVVRGEDVLSSPAGLSFWVSEPRGRFRIQSPLLGAYNAHNMLAAWSAGLVLGIPPEVVVDGLESFQGVPGRMERIDLGQPFTAIVDFAHTPNALRRALETARQLTDRRVIAVFGSAGLRDREKRRLMAEVSAELADLTILTAEDPRIEPLEGILEQMAEGARSKGGREGQTFWRVPDRGAALRFAVQLAEPGDLVIACGKGHEQSMCFGETEYPWDDRTALRAALASMLSVPGPPMPELPTSSGG